MRTAPDRQRRRPRRAQVARGAYLARAGNCFGCHTERGGVRRRPRDRDAVRHRLRAEPHARPRPASAPGRRRLLARAAQRPRARRPAALSGVPVPELHARRARRCRRDVRVPAQPAAGRAAEPAACAALPVRPAGRARGLARALLPAGAFRERCQPPGAEWNRGAYLVEGLGHCNACHSSRNALGAPAGPLDLAGGLIPVQNWYAPARGRRRPCRRPPTRAERARRWSCTWTTAPPATATTLSAWRPRRLSGARRQSRHRADAAGEPCPHRAARRLSAVDRGQSAAVRHAAVREHPRRQRRVAEVLTYVRRHGAAARRRSRVEVSRYRGAGR